MNKFINIDNINFKKKKPNGDYEYYNYKKCKCCNKKFLSRKYKNNPYCTEKCQKNYHNKINKKENLTHELIS